MSTLSASGTTLNDSNIVSTFSAANTTSGDVQFNDSATPLTITGITQNGGNVQVVNYGDLRITGTIQDTAASGIVSILERNADIQETGSGEIEANYLISQSKTGTVLNSANQVSNYLAWNDPNGGNMQFTNTIPLTIQLVIETGGNLTIVNSGGMQITGTIKAQTGTVSLKDSTAGITESGGLIFANSLITQSVTGTILNGNNLVGTLNATNTTSGDVQFNNNSDALLTVAAVSESGGNVQVINFGGENAVEAYDITGLISDTTAGGIVSVKEWSADIEESGSGAIDAGTIITQSKSGTLLMGDNIVYGVIAVNDPNGGNTELNDHTSTVNIAEIFETGGNVVVDNTGAITQSSGESIPLER